MIRPRHCRGFSFRGHVDVWQENIKKEQERRLDVAEMKMIRWSMGKTRKDRIRNDSLRNAMGIRAVSEKVQGNRLRWYGHVQRRDSDYCGKLAEQITIPGKRRRGRPLMTWHGKLTNDMKENDLLPDMVHDRSAWRSRILKADPPRSWTRPLKT